MKIIKKTFYLNVIKHIPSIINDFRFKFGNYGQKITIIKLKLNNNSNEDVYNEIKINDPKLLDYLNINNPEELTKINEYMDCIV